MGIMNEDYLNSRSNPLRLRLVKRTKDEKIAAEFRELIEDQEDAIRDAKTDNFNIVSALLELKRLLLEKKITGNDKVSRLVSILEERYKNSLDIINASKDILP